VSGQLQAPGGLRPGKQPPGTHWIGSLGGPWVDLKVLEKRYLAHSLVTIPTEVSRIHNLQYVRCRLWNAVIVRRILRDTTDRAQTTTQLACRLRNTAFVSLYRKTPLSKHCRRADLAEEAVVRHLHLFTTKHPQTRHKVQEGCTFMTCLSTDFNTADKLDLQDKRTGRLQDWFSRTVPSKNIVLNPNGATHSAKLNYWTSFPVKPALLIDTAPSHQPDTGTCTNKDVRTFLFMTYCNTLPVAWSVQPLLGW
jgi:hypothetical protein